jgi:DinB superfamily
MAKTAEPDPLRRHVLNLLTKAEAHVDLRSTLSQFPRELCGAKPPGAPHTPWQLLEHMRIAQWDILQFSLNPEHKSPKWPEEYWPKSEVPPSGEAWDKSVSHLLGDLDSVCQLVNSPEHDLFAGIPHGDGQTLLREALLVADHNAYHLGELVMLRRILEGK